MNKHTAFFRNGPTVTVKTEDANLAIQVMSFFGKPAYKDTIALCCPSCEREQFFMHVGDEFSGEMRLSHYICYLCGVQVTIITPRHIADMHQVPLTSVVYAVRSL